MDADTLYQAMGRSLSVARYAALVDTFTAGMLAAGCTTEARAAMWCAQVGHESLGLLYMEELASGAAYEGRSDLGNTQPGDGRRFKGRGPIQLTGRGNYARFSSWCKSRGLVDAADYFVRNPTAVAEPRWGFLAAAWYWTVERPKLNALADAGDIVGATKAVNGGTNGLDDRKARWDYCRRLGAALLPAASPAPAPVSTRPKGLPLMIERELVPGRNRGTVNCPTGRASGLVAQAWVSVRAQGGATGTVWFQVSADVDGSPPGAGPAFEVAARNGRRAWAEIPSGTEYLEYDMNTGGPGSLLIEMRPA